MNPIFTHNGYQSKVKLAPNAIIYLELQIPSVQQNQLYRFQEMSDKRVIAFDVKL